MSCINIIFGHKYPISGKILPFSCKLKVALLKMFILKAYFILKYKGGILITLFHQALKSKD
jgi:hypothetical protein